MAYGNGSRHRLSRPHRPARASAAAGLLLAGGLLALPSVATRADDPPALPGGEGGSSPATRPVATQPVSTQPVATQPATGVGTELLQPKGPATRPAVAATAPATAPAIVVSADARALLDAVRDAYKTVKTLSLAGTITSDIDVNGEQSNDRAEFTAAFAAAPLRFSHRTRERMAGTVAANPPDVHPPAASGAAALRDSTAFGSTGKKFWAFEPRYNYYYLADAPAARTASGELPDQVRGLVTQLNPSLLLAVVPDAAEELLDGVDAVAKVPDVTIGDTACPALRLSIGTEDVLTLAFDPGTHLVRRVVWDRKGYALAKKQQDVKKVLVTVDYTQSDLTKSDLPADGGATKPAATQPDATAVADAADPFAWRPPAGARDVTSLADAGSADDIPDGAAQALVGQPAPDFKLKDLAGREVKLADLKGQVVLLDFWATWCGPCVESLPRIDAIHKDLAGRGLKAFAVNVREEPGEVKKFVRDNKLTIPVLLDPEGKAARAYGAAGIPETVVIDKSGKVTKVFLGAGTHEQVRAAVEEAMGGAAKPE